MIQPHAHILWLSSLLACFVTPASAQSTWLVDRAGDGDFETIQAAIDAAQSGDTVLVADAALDENLTIDGKGISLLVRWQSNESVGGLTVSGVPAGEALTISGFLLDGSGPYAVQVSDCEGPVRFEDCTVWGGGIRATRVTSLSLNSVTADGLAGSFGLLAESSRVDAHESRFRGAIGYAGSSGIPCSDGGPGGDAVRLRLGSILRATNSEIFGGLGGDATGQCSFGPPGNGVVMDATSRAFARDSIVSTTIGGTYSVSTSMGPTFEVEAYFPVDASIPLEVQSLPGDRAFLVAGAPSGFRPLGDERGALHVLYGAAAGAPLDPFPVRPLGIVPSSGQLNVDVAQLATSVPSGSEHAPALSLQVFVQRPGSGTFFSEPHVVHFFGDDVPIRVDGEPVRVQRGTTVSGLGRSWLEPYARLKLALRRTWGRPSEGREFWIAEGTFAVSATSTFLARPADRLYGGFRGTEQSVDERDPATPRTVLTADVLGNDGPSAASRDDNSTGLLAAGWSFLQDSPSGPFLIDSLSLRGVSSSNPFEICSVVTSSGSVRIVNCEMTDNRCFRGTMVFSHGGCVIEDSVMRGNLGLGLSLNFQNTSEPSSIVNSLISNNIVEFSLVSANGRMMILNSSIVNNRVGSTTLRFRSPQGTNPRVRNSILYGNNSGGDATFDLQYQSPDGTPLAVAYSCVSGWAGQFGGLAVFDADPLFAGSGPDGQFGTADDDLRLRSGSPCVDAGNNLLVPSGLLLDLDGELRRKDDLGTPDTGLGSGPIVDLGAYEL